MKLTDYTPLFAMIVLVVCLVAIVVLAITHIEVPDIIGTVAALALATLFGSSAVRGTSPPPTKPDGEGVQQ